jgi:hypothetical protein
MLRPLVDLLFQGNMDSTSAPPLAQWQEAERLLTDSTVISNVGKGRGAAQRPVESRGRFLITFPPFAPDVF